jgi:hypothetical protein
MAVPAFSAEGTGEMSRKVRRNQGRIAASAPKVRRDQGRVAASVPEVRRPWTHGCRRRVKRAPYEAEARVPRVKAFRPYEDTLEACTTRGVTVVPL